MVIHCDFCFTTFKSKSLLNQHHAENTHCFHYTKHVMITCKKCTSSVTDLDSHLGTCTGTFIESSPYETLKVQYFKLDLENKDLVRTLAKKQALEELLHEYQTLFKLETFKSKIYRNIIMQNTSINVDNIFLEKQDGLHVYNFNGGNIPIFVHENCKNDDLDINHASIDNLIKHKGSTDGPEIDSKGYISDAKGTKSKVRSTRKLPKKIQYKKVPPKVNTKNKQESNSNTSNTGNIDTIDNMVNDTSMITTPVAVVTMNSQEIKSKLAEILDNLKNTRNFTKPLEEIKILRARLAGSITLTEYHDILVNQVKIIESVFREKGYPNNKVIITMFKNLTPLESRLLFYTGYINTSIDNDDMQLASQMIDNSLSFPKEYDIFDMTEVYKLFCNYGVVFFPLKHLITKYLINPHGYWNVIYLQHPKSTDKDPYSFYVLGNVKKGKRYWNMNCRLENLSLQLVSNVLSYMISLFRKLYSDSFGDNDFRPGYWEKTIVMETDSEQLLQNIILLCKPREICDLIRSIIKEKCTYVPDEENDKFDIYADDLLMRKRFQEREQVDHIEIIKRIFDEITNEQAVDFYREKTKK